MRAWMMSLAMVALVGCQPAGGGGGGGGHARGYQLDVDACFRAASRAEADLAKGDRAGAVQDLDGLLARLDRARGHSWLSERREWLRVEERAVLASQAIATAHPAARDRLHGLTRALEGLAHGQSLAGREGPRTVLLGPGERPGLGDAAAICRNVRDLLARGDAAGALVEIAALRRRLREARAYGSKAQVADLDALAGRARRLEQLAADLDPRARVQAGLLAADLGDDHPATTAALK